MSESVSTPPVKAERYGTQRPKVPPFARYKGTSAWRKYRRRARAYAMFLAAEKHAGSGVSAPSAA